MHLISCQIDCSVFCIDFHHLELVNLDQAHLVFTSISLIGYWKIPAKRVMWKISKRLFFQRSELSFLSFLKFFSFCRKYLAKSTDSQYSRGKLKNSILFLLNIIFNFVDIIFNYTFSSFFCFNLFIVFSFY